jgi:prepilin-type N-terminal cleavage/methylation domain-containing protein
MRPETRRGFTLVELLVSISVLVLMVLLISRLLFTATSTVNVGQRHIETDGQVRPLFDRIASDFAQMVKRADVDFYGKGTSTGGTMTGASMGTINDRIAFYSGVPGDYPTTGSQSPFSMIAYKVNSSTAVANKEIYTRLQRMARGLLMNGESSDVKDGPLIFGPTSLSTIWTSVTSNATTDSKYEVACAQVFRFEYYYLLTNGAFSITPWDASAGHTNASGLRDVTAIVVAVAAIDQASRVLLASDNSQIATIATKLPDYAVTMGPGQLLAQWQTKLSTDVAIKAMPRPAINGIRLYERAFYLNPTSQ